MTVGRPGRDSVASRQALAQILIVMNPQLLQLLGLFPPGAGRVES